jgi:hypothetical protein
VPISSTKASFPLLFSKFRAFCNAKLYFKF